MIPSKQQLNKTLTRFQSREKERSRNMRLIKEKKYFDIDSPERVKKFLQHRNIGEVDTNEIMKSERGVPVLIETEPVTKVGKSLERILGTNDLVDISFLQKALNISKTIGRIWICNAAGSPIGYGTGFMISPSLLMTNHHVLPDAGVARNAKVEFNYEFDIDQVLLPTEMFAFQPNVFYYSDEDLDYAIVSVAPESKNRAKLGDYGFNKLLREEGKTIISQWLNVIEHPNGLPKQIGLRENQLIDILENFLQYKTDTAPGASGSPVYNERWEVVGLHHSGVYEQDAQGNIISVDGGIWHKSMGEDRIKWTMNEGVKISSILKHMDSRNLPGNHSTLYNQLFNASPTELSTRTTSGMMPLMNGHTDYQEARSNPDGSKTWVIPVSITVNVGATGTPVPSSNGHGKASNVSIVPDAEPKADDQSATATSEETILQKAKLEFYKRGDVLNVRMGYVFENGWITKRRALVVSVPQRKTIAELRELNISPLPKTFMGYPVEVSGPTINELVAFKYGQERLETLVQPATVNTDEIRYEAPAGTDLERRTEQMKVLAHVGPEHGWEELQPFLEDTQESLTVGMFDFGAKHILESIKTVGTKPGFDNMTLAIQATSSVGDGTKKDDLTDSQMVAELEDNLGDKFQRAWVQIGSVNGWVSSSYHIKVAVKDKKAFWLSSGNWQSSNQPDLETLQNPTQAFLLNTYNREWNVIVEHPALAELYEKFILNDFENNKNFVPVNEALMQEELFFLVPESEFRITAEENATFQAFEPFAADRVFTVTPILSPDNYFKEVLNLVKSAQSELYIQNQTFNAPKDTHLKLKELIEAVRQKQQQGVDVKIIFRNFMASVARENVEALVDMGFDASAIKMHSKCHTKAIIVDGKKVLFGSQNWSNDGVSVNRDASLLFEDEALAGYFRNIFMHDWDRLAKQSIGSESLSLEIATDTENIPAGMRLVGWSEIKELL